MGSMGNTVIWYFLRSASPDADPEMKVGAQVNDEGHALRGTLESGEWRRMTPSMGTTQSSTSA